MENVSSFLKNEYFWNLNYNFMKVNAYFINKTSESSIDLMKVMLIACILNECTIEEINYRGTEQKILSQIISMIPGVNLKILEVCYASHSICSNLNYMGIVKINKNEKKLFDFLSKIETIQLLEMVYYANEKISYK